MHLVPKLQNKVLTRTEITPSIPPYTVDSIDGSDRKCSDFIGRVKGPLKLKLQGWTYRVVPLLIVAVLPEEVAKNYSTTATRVEAVAGGCKR